MRISDTTARQITLKIKKGPRDRHIPRFGSYRITGMSVIDSESSASTSELGDARDIDAEESVLQDDEVLNRDALARYREVNLVSTGGRDKVSGKGYGIIDRHIDIWLAAKLNHIDRIRELLEIGIDPNLIDPWDATPLYYTSSCGYEGATTLLLRFGATADPHQFVGARCVYAALNDRVRRLLRDSRLIGKRKSPLQIAMAMMFRNANSMELLSALQANGDDRFDGMPDFSFVCLTPRSTGPHRDDGGRSVSSQAGKWGPQTIDAQGFNSSGTSTRNSTQLAG